ncbi:MAG: pyruvate-ferredoxin/flavodoxin oxidoreductase [Cellvibrionaceae bacterium]|jgi:pyruvate-ferredoxin/flavodoxin oxidoreductase
MGQKTKTLDGNEAVAKVAYQVNDVIAIYPITPSSPIGEWADQYAADIVPNLWGAIPQVVEMQSEGGAAGAVHGALQAGALTTTFTASQGLLLMIPNMYKIAGELTSTVFHIAARSVAAQALSIFGDHSDVMAARSTGFAMLFANSVQEAHDFALISTAAALETRIPFLHIFDGFRTSHEINKIELLDETVIRQMISDDAVFAHRARGLTPDKPVVRGTAQNPDVFFQARESVNPYYQACPNKVQVVMDRFAQLTGRQYKIYEYIGPADAERVIVLMGSGAETAQETVEYLNTQNKKVGVLKVRLYRPLDGSAFLAALPASVKAIAVLDRTKEPGASGEPLYQDVVTTLMEGFNSGEAPFKGMPRIIGGRYGLSSKEFTPAMVKRIFDELKTDRPKNHFTIGINDDVTHTSLSVDPSFRITKPDEVQAVFYGLGSDGTVGANKNSIKIIGENTPNFAQAYFVYDSKKAGAVTVSHLRFGPRPIHSTYLVDQADFIGCHQFGFLERYDVLRLAAEGATFLLNSPYGPDEVWEYLPRSMQATIIDKNLEFYVIDAVTVAQDSGMGRRINTIMQTCFFALFRVLPKDEAIEAIKSSIEKSYIKRGQAVIDQNFAAVDAALSHLQKVTIPAVPSSNFERPPVVPGFAPEFVQSVTARIIEGLGDSLPVSMLPADGTYPTGTTQYEKRNISDEIPVWDPDICIQCGKCAFVCPHSVIRMKLVDQAEIAQAPESLKHSPARYKEFKEKEFILQVSPEDCTGCTLCVDICPVKNKATPKLKAINMAAQKPILAEEKTNWDYFQTLPEIDRTTLPLNQVKYNQLLEPLFEFSGACAGCGETPYLSLLSRLFGDRALIANATGCSSIYGGNLPTTPWAKNGDGRGPAWSNSLFEDNAEFGMGMRVALDQRVETAMHLLLENRELLGEQLVDELLTADQSAESGIQAQRERVAKLKSLLDKLVSCSTMEHRSIEQSTESKLRNLNQMADVLVKKSVWIVGGDGWAYDIGFGGLDHVLASGRNVNVLVLDTEVYSNTGGQMSKATPRGAVAKFAAAGKPMPKKDLGMIAVSYGNIYVAKVALGANDRQTVNAFLEAEAYDGPSLIIAYSHCIAHGYDLRFGNQQQKAAVNSGHWPLYRFNPAEQDNEKSPIHLDSKAPSIKLEDYIYFEGRYRMLAQRDPESAKRLLDLAKSDVANRWQQLTDLATSENR